MPVLLEQKFQRKLDLARGADGAGDSSCGGQRSFRIAASREDGP